MTSKLKLSMAGLALMIATVTGCQKNADDSIAQSLKAKIAADPDLKTTGVNAMVKDGRVTLIGTVPNADIELKAVKLANSEHGVTKVNDQLTVGVQTAGTNPDNPSAGQPNPPAGDQAGQPPAGQAPAGQQPAPVATVPQSSSAPAPNPPPTEPAPVAATERAAAPAPRPEPVLVNVPAGTAIVVRMIDSVDSAVNQRGQRFRASLSAPVRVGQRLIAPRGTDVVVQLAEAKGAGRVAGKAELELQLVSMTVAGRSYGLVSNAYTVEGKSRGVQTAKRAGIGAGVGAIIGAIAGGGKGAAIGAAVGGGGATTFQIFTRGQQVRIPAESQIHFTLQAPVTVELRRA